MDNPIWVLINCNSLDEAKEIGKKMLAERLGSCFDVFSREITAYFWPAKSGYIETAKGVLLVVETFEGKFEEIKSRVKKSFRRTAFYWVY